MTFVTELCTDFICTKQDSRCVEEGISLRVKEILKSGIWKAFGGSVPGFGPVQCKIPWQDINGNNVEFPIEFNA